MKGEGQGWEAVLRPGPPWGVLESQRCDMPNAFARPPDYDFLWPHLCAVPFFRALLRAVEARFYQDLPMEAPVLDLGCGDGDFAAQAFSRPLDAGVDPWHAPLCEAARRGAYRLVARADGAHLPFADASFRTVISNSVLEHIPALEPVMAECARVLEPGGYLLFCTPSEHFTDWLLGARVLGDGYRRFFNRVSRHYHCKSPQEWQALLANYGFAVERWWYYFSPRALRALELGHYLGAPNLLTRWLTGQWVCFPSRRNPYLRLLERLLRPIYEAPLPAVGAYVFVVARREGRSRPLAR